MVAVILSQHYFLVCVCVCAVLASARWQNAVDATTDIRSARSASHSGAWRIISRISLTSVCELSVRGLSSLSAALLQQARPLLVRSVASTGLFGVIQKPTPHSRYQTINRSSVYSRNRQWRLMWLIYIQLYSHLICSTKILWKKINII